MGRVIDEDKVVQAIDDHTIETDDGLVLDEDITIILENVSSAQEEKWISEIREAYDRAVKNPYIKKPLSQALYEVWHRYDASEVERR